MHKVGHFNIRQYFKSSDCRYIKIKCFENTTDVKRNKTFSHKITVISVEYGLVEPSSNSARGCGSLTSC